MDSQKHKIQLQGQLPGGLPEHSFSFQDRIKVEVDLIKIETTLRATLQKSCYFQKAAVTLPQDQE